MYFPAEQIRTDANKTTHKTVQFIKIKWIFTCHQVQMMEKVNVKFPSVNSLTNGRTMKGEVSVPVNDEGSCQRNTHESRRYFMIAVEEEGVSFIFSPHSYSPDTHTHTCYYRQEDKQLETLKPLWDESIFPLLLLLCLILTEWCYLASVRSPSQGKAHFITHQRWAEKRL